jgi:CHASE3 domain sensor protein
MAPEPFGRTHLQRLFRSGLLRSLGVPLLAVTSALMIAALVLMGMTLSNLKDSRRQSEAAQDTLLELTTIESRLMDFDGALSGYALSGIPWYQMRMKDDHSELQAALAKLGHSLRNDPEQLRRYKSIVTQIAKRDAYNAYLTKPEHRGEIARSETAQSARIVTDDIRGRLWEVLDSERTKRRLNQLALVGEAQNSFRIAVGIVLLTFVFAALCLLLSTGPKDR